MSVQWYCVVGGEILGPMPAEQLKGLVASGRLRPESSVRRTTDHDWMPAGRIKGLFVAAPHEGAPGGGLPLAAPVARPVATSPTPANTAPPPLVAQPAPPRAIPAAAPARPAMAIPAAAPPPPAMSPGLPVAAVVSPAQPAPQPPPGAAAAQPHPKGPVITAVDTGPKKRVSAAAAVEEGGAEGGMIVAAASLGLAVTAFVFVWVAWVPVVVAAVGVAVGLFCLSTRHALTFRLGLAGTILGGLALVAGGVGTFLQMMQAKPPAVAAQDADDEGQPVLSPAELAALRDAEGGRAALPADAAAGASNADQTPPAATPAEPAVIDARLTAVRAVGRWYAAPRSATGLRNIVRIKVAEAWRSSDPRGTRESAPRGTPAVGAAIDGAADTPPVNAAAAAIGKAPPPDGTFARGDDAVEDSVLDDPVRTDGASGAHAKAASPPPVAGRFLFIRVQIGNLQQDRPLRYTSWNGTGGHVAGTMALLVDDADRVHEPVPYETAPSPERLRTIDIAPQDEVTDLLVFEAPAGNFQRLRLVLPYGAVVRASEFPGFDLPEAAGFEIDAEVLDQRPARLPGGSGGGYDPDQPGIDPILRGIEELGGGDLGDHFGEEHEDALPRPWEQPAGSGDPPLATPPATPRTTPVTTPPATPPAPGGKVPDLDEENPFPETGSIGADSLPPPDEEEKSLEELNRDIISGGGGDQQPLPPEEDAYIR